MRRFRLFLAAFAMVLSTAAFASPTSEFHPDKKERPISTQIEKMLSDSDLIINEGLTVTVIFRLNEESRIEIRSVKSPNEEVNSFLKKRLEGQRLHGNSWDREKIYELPVKVEAVR